MQRKNMITLAVLALLLMLAACAPTSTAPPDANGTGDGVLVEVTQTVEGPDISPTADSPPTLSPDDEQVLRLADVESVTVTLEANEVVMVASGHLPDGCTAIDAVSQSVTDNTLNATITTVRDPLALCTEAIVPFEETIRFDRTNLPAGEYTAQANGVRTVIAIPNNEGDLNSGATIYLIALEDGGQQGEAIGCGDSLVPVQVTVGGTGQDPLATAMQALLSTDGANYGAGLTNPLVASELTLASAEVSDGVATIALEGELMIGGVCDEPRLEAQLQRTAAQFANVETVMITVNGEPLDSILGGQGAGLPPAAVLEAQSWLAEQTGVPVEQVEIDGIEQVEWSDSCLGLGGPAESCLAAITPGWRVLFTVNGEQYEVRTDETGQAIRSPQIN